MKKTDKHIPPKWIDSVLERICDPYLLEGILGDLHEKYEELLQTEKPRFTAITYLWVAIGFLRPYTWKKKNWIPQIPFAMWKNYFKIAIRNLYKYKVQSIINILGLTIGLAGCIIIGLYLKDELSYDRFHPAPERTYRVYDERISADDKSYIALTPPQFGPTLGSLFPEVVNTMRIARVYDKMLFEFEDKKLLEDHGIYAESSLFDFFGIDLLKGDTAKALSEPNAILLSEQLATKYFGEEEAVGKIIKINNQERYVRGVFADLPHNFHLNLEYIFPFITLENIVPEERMQSWIWQQFYTYIQIAPQADIQELKQKFLAHVEQVAHPQTEPIGFVYEPYFQQIEDIHLHSYSFQWDMAKRGNILNVYALACMGLFLLIIACINFVNLTTALAEQRAKEVGIRKATGAKRGQIISQFLGEAMLVTLIATLLSLLITQLALPHINEFAQLRLSLNPLFHLSWALPVVGMVLAIGLIAGSYPALTISKFSPLTVLRGSHMSLGSRKHLVRKGLVILQFSLSIFLIISTLFIQKQVSYLNQKELGFNREHVLTFRLRGNMYNRMEQVKAEFQRIPRVLHTTIGYGFPGDIVAGDDIIVPGENKTYSANLFTIDHDYVSTMELEVIVGRDFSKAIQTDATEAFIINETAVKEMGLGSPESAVGQPLHWRTWSSNRDSLKKGRIIGVVKDFHFKSLHEKVGTAILHIYPDAYSKVAVKVSGESLPETLAAIEGTWNNLETGYPFDYQFIDESFDAMYKEEERMNTLLQVFTLLTIFVACIGLLSLVSFSAQQRTKEIGIRKVLGASRSQILRLLTREFVVLVGLSFLVAAPFAWWALKSWLENFPYHVKLGLGTFLLAGIGTLLIALITVSLHSLKAASADPVGALKYE